MSNPLPKIIVTSVVRSSNQGESHGGVYLIDLETENYEKVIDTELWQVECDTGQVKALVIGSMGTITKDTQKTLKELQLAKKAQSIQMSTIKESINSNF